MLFSKSDELTKAARLFLERLKTQVKNGEVFYTQEIRKKLRISSSTIHRHIRELKVNGYLKYKGGNKFRGYEYQIADYQEYDQLKNQIDQRLQDILLKINKQGIPVSQTYPISENGINKSQAINALT